MMADRADARNGQIATRIGDLRTAIDAIDDCLLNLINERLKLAARIGSIKQVAGNPVKDQVREAHIIKRLQDTNQGPIDNELLSRVFVDIIRASCHLQNTIRSDAPDTERDQHG
jgi:chorismate mutase/prephenate dehydratase